MEDQKRVGVVERSGRGVDTIFRGMLKFGRPSPDYSRTDAHGVVVRLPTDPADRDFRRLVVEEERRRGAELPIDSLIALAAGALFFAATLYLFGSALGVKGAPAQLLNLLAGGL